MPTLKNGFGLPTFAANGSVARWMVLKNKPGTTPRRGGETMAVLRDKALSPNRSWQGIKDNDLS